MPITEAAKRWKRANPDKVRAANQRRKQRRAIERPEIHREKNRAEHLRQRFKMTLAEYDAKFTAQKGVCAICGLPQTHRLLAVDHCHATRKVRDLLCDGCNIGLGNFKDNPALLEQAKLYLERHAPTNS